MNYGKERVIIENVYPEIDGGRFPVKRVRGEAVQVRADIFADGHDEVSAVLRYRQNRKKQWSEKPMCCVDNDRWEAEFRIREMDDYRYTIIAWMDHFKTWLHDFNKKLAAENASPVDVAAGIELIERTRVRIPGADALKFKEIIAHIKKERDLKKVSEYLSASQAVKLMNAHADRTGAAVYAKELQVAVDREKALFSAWYEMFPRSASPRAGAHGTFKDCERLLPDINRMGFDVLYLPPIHPIGKTNRKGRNNTEHSRPGDPGSPWAIGSADGGHTAIEPKLGTLKDFSRFVKKARGFGLEIALDLALQCSPDHPYVTAHPQWFKKRADGSIRFAENPPKKYEDIVPFNFETEDGENLYQEIKKIFLFWIAQGIMIYRVDNPHTKPFRFWDRLLGEIKTVYPDVIFLSEAFTKPKTMYRLAKGGFTQSYTYFTWRNTKQEIITYLTELTQTEIKEYFRPHFWPNTPDILPEILQKGGRPAFISRFLLAAALSSNYGIYGPAYELCVNTPLPGKEEYADSEKYEIKQWQRKQEGNISSVIERVNRIRRENPALQATRNVTFLQVDNDALIFFSKQTDDASSVIMTAVNIDPFNIQSGWVQVPIKDFGIKPDTPYMMHDLLSGEKYIWRNERNFIKLDPAVMPGHIFRLEKK